MPVADQPTEQSGKRARDPCNLPGETELLPPSHQAHAPGEVHGAGDPECARVERRRGQSSRRRAITSRGRAPEAADTTPSRSMRSTMRAARL